MTGNKRFTYLNYSRDGHIGSFYLNDKPITNKEVCALLKEQEEQITALKSILGNTNMANARLKEQIKAISKELDYIQNSITDKIKHQKTKIGEKALKEVIEDYNKWILGHKEVVK